MPRPARDISWVVETRGITLLRPKGDPAVSIPYPFAALWALIAEARYTPLRARSMMAVLLRVGEPAAEREIERVLTAWETMGLLDRD
jgi:hypothetical protein